MQACMGTDTLPHPSRAHPPGRRSTWRESKKSRSTSRVRRGPGKVRASNSELDFRKIPETSRSRNPRILDHKSGQQPRENPRLALQSASGEYSINSRGSSALKNAAGLEQLLIKLGARLPTFRVPPRPMPLSNRANQNKFSKQAQRTRIQQVLGDTSPSCQKA